jgi:hypothetical protein
MELRKLFTLKLEPLKGNIMKIRTTKTFKMSKTWKRLLAVCKINKTEFRELIKVATVAEQEWKNRRAVDKKDKE